MKKILLEAVLVALTGAAFAFAANQISPKGLSLTWNYFGGTNDAVPRPVAMKLEAGNPETNPPSTVDLRVAQLKAEGLQSVIGSQALDLSRGAPFEQGKVVFIDARNQQDYQAGHVPGAYAFDPFDREKYERNLLEMLSVCRDAEQVVVYCQGGECDASELAARYLAGAGIPKEKLFVYLGGIAEWNNQKWPIELGARNSGNLRNPGK